MEDPLSRGSWGRLDGSAGEGGGCVGGKAAPHACASSAWLRLSREDVLGDLPPALLRAPAGADFGRHGVALGDDRLGLADVDRTTVDVAHDIGCAPLHD